MEIFTHFTQKYQTHVAVPRLFSVFLSLFFSLSLVLMSTKTHLNRFPTCMEMCWNFTQIYMIIIMINVSMYVYVCLCTQCTYNNTLKIVIIKRVYFDEHTFRIDYFLNWSPLKLSSPIVLMILWSPFALTCDLFLFRLLSLSFAIGNNWSEISKITHQYRVSSHSVIVRQYPYEKEFRRS